MARKRNGSFPESVQPGLPVLEPLPNGWQREPLGKRVKEVQRPVRMQDNSSYNLVTVKRSRGGAVKRETLRGKDIKVKSQYEVHSGDFLISKRQIVHGACAIVPAELHGAIVSNEYSVLNCKDNLDSIFLKYLSETKYFQQTCFHSSIGVHVEKMVFKLDRWFKWEFNFPPHKEQQKISRVLSTWDAAIDCTQNLLENSKQQKKTLMQQLLTGKKRLPGFSEKWHFKKLKEITASITMGSTPSRTNKSYWGAGYPWISIADMTAKYITHTKEEITERAVRRMKPIPPGTLIMSFKLSLGKLAFVAKEMYSNEAICAFNQLNANSDFIYYILGKIDFTIHTGLAVKGKTLNKESLRLIEVPYPSFQEQTAIAEVLSSCDAVIAQYEAKLANLQAQKKALMQQLLTGKRRVKLNEPADTSAA